MDGENSNNNKDNSNVSNSGETNLQSEQRRVINEADYAARAPIQSGPTAIGKGGDPFFRKIKATKEQLLELIEETQTVQDWVQRESSNNVALACLDNENLKDIYFAIKDGFSASDKVYGKIALMGFKSPTGVEIPRLKIYDTDGEVIDVLTGPLAIDELNKRAIAYKNSKDNYEKLPDDFANKEIIRDYKAK